MLLTNFKENCTNLCRRRTCLDVKNLAIPEENITEKSEEKSEKEAPEIRQACWNDMLKKLTRRRRFSLKGKKTEINV